MEIYHRQTELPTRTFDKRDETTFTCKLILEPGALKPNDEREQHMDVASTHYMDSLEQYIAQNVKQ